MKWYQNVDGVEGAVFKDPLRKGSKFWGQGKWDNFIKPLLPAERRVFVEIGCNAGLFLKLAMDEGFENVIGIEASSQRMKQAERFRESNGYLYRLIQQKAGKDFELDQLPLADVILFANVHYYLPIHVFANLVDRLRTRTLYCIVVSAKATRRQGRARHYLESVRGYFRDWQEMEVVGDWKGAETLDDPSPRVQMYGVLFKGGLESWDVKQYWDRRDAADIKAKRKREAAGIKVKGPERFMLSGAVGGFFRKVLNGEEFDFKETSLYEYWRARGWLPEDIEKKLAYNKWLFESVQRDGMKAPVYCDGKGHLLDGSHRLHIVRELGYKHVLVRRL